MSRRIILSAALLIAAGLAAWVLRPRTAASLEASTAIVERADLQVTVSASGRVVAHLDVDIKCKASGTVVTLPVDVGSTVKEDDLLLSLDPIDEQRSLDQVAASLAGAEARLAQAMQNLVIAGADLVTSTAKAKANLTGAQSRANDATARSARLAKLREKGLTCIEDAETAAASAQQSAAEVEVALSEVEALKSLEKGLEVKRQEVVAAQAQVASGKAALALAQCQVKDTTIHAPMAGTITSCNVQVGSIISSGITNVGGGTAILTLSDLSRLTVLAAVDEADIARVQVGQTASIAVDAFPEHRFCGRVVHVAVRGTNVSNVVTFEVKVEVDDEDRGLLKPEMTARVEIATARRDGTLCVPVAALTRRGSGWVVQIMEANGQGREQPVEVGISDGQRSEVRSGVAVGDCLRLRSSAPASTWQKQQGTMPPPPPGDMP
jgi:HlyD family secretion protein